MLGIQPRPSDGQRPRRGASALAAMLALALAACSSSAPDDRRCSAALGYPPPPALDGFETVSSGPIRIHHRPGLAIDQATVAALARHRDEVSELLGTLYLPPPGAQIDYYLYADSLDKNRGFPCRGSSPAVVAGYDGRHEVHNYVLSLHELVHVYTVRDPDRCWSQVFNEGIAVYLGDLRAFGDAEMPPSELTGYMPAETWLAAVPPDELPSIPEIHAWPSNRRLTKKQRVVRYLSAGSFVRYLFEARDPSIVRGYLAGHVVPCDDVRDAQLIEALESAYGTQMATLEQAWRAWMASK